MGYSKKKKLDVLKSLEEACGEIKATCKGHGISRTTFFNWEEDEQLIDGKHTFKELSRDIIEGEVDQVESSLFKEAKAGNVTAQIFIMKTKGKDRGYTERTEIVQKNVDEFEGRTEEEIRLELESLREKANKKKKKNGK